MPDITPEDVEEARQAAAALQAWLDAEVPGWQLMAPAELAGRVDEWLVPRQDQWAAREAAEIFWQVWTDVRAGRRPEARRN